jgi:hypothetical protein
MTNKLRSVIDELHYNSTTMTVDPDSQQVVYYEDAVKAVLKTLDVIIEEMEEELLSLQYKLNTHRHDSKEYAFMYACKTNQELNVHKLKQAREELSTSLTQ